MPAPSPQRCAERRKVKRCGCTARCRVHDRERDKREGGPAPMQATPAQQSRCDEAYREGEREVREGCEQTVQQLLQRRQRSGLWFDERIRWGHFATPFLRAVRRAVSAVRASAAP